MTEKLTRKDFFAVAATGVAAVGAATLIPSTKAIAEEVEKEVAAQQEQAEPVKDITPLSDLDIAGVEHGVEALGDTAWAEIAPLATEVVKSRSGFHMMNEPGYFTFTGWNPQYDTATDMGFGYKADPQGGAFILKAKVVDFIGVNGRMGQLGDWVVESSSSTSATGWHYTKWASGKLECSRRGTWSTGTMGASQVTGTTQKTCTLNWKWPVAFKQIPIVTISPCTGSNWTFLIDGHTATTTNLVNVYVRKTQTANDTSGFTAAISLTAVGRWK